MAIATMRQARVGAANTIGMIRISGGIGKTELSANAMTASQTVAWRCAASPMVQSYRRRSINTPTSVLIVKFSIPNFA